VAGRWRYVYRAIDQLGQVIDVFVSLRRDAKAARRFFERAIGVTKVTPAEVTTDLAPAYPAVLEELPAPGTVPTGTPTTGSRQITVG
jgi:transposase-like protein